MTLTEARLLVERTTGRRPHGAEWVAFGTVRVLLEGGCTEDELQWIRIGSPVSIEIRVEDRKPEF